MCSVGCEESADLGLAVRAQATAESLSVVQSRVRDGRPGTARVAPLDRHALAVERRREAAAEADARPAGRGGLQLDPRGYRHLHGLLAVEPLRVRPVLQRLAR